MSIAAGRLRHQVRIDQLVEVVDSSGDPVRGPQGEFLKEWEEVATVWAAIEPLSAREFIQSASVQAQISARIIIRKRDGLDPAMQLVHMVNGVATTYFDPAGFLADKESGLEYLTIPVSLALNRTIDPEPSGNFLSSDQDDSLLVVDDVDGQLLTLDMP